MMDNEKPPRAVLAFANMVVDRPRRVLAVLLLLFGLSVWGASKLTINSNQLDLISQDLQEVKDVKRVIDMVGGSGFLMLALRAENADLMKAVADDIAEKLRADKEYVRSVTYKQPVEFIQENMVLFVKTEDLQEVRKRVNGVIKDRMRRASPVFFEIVKTEPKTLDLEDIIKKYSSVGKKSIRDDYYISDDRLMLMMLIKPMWDTTAIGRTKELMDRMDALFADYSKNNKHMARLVLDDEKVGQGTTVSYGYTGSYVTSVDDSYAIHNSLEPVTIIAFIGIALVIAAFFRRWAPIVIVLLGITIGTLLTMGFTYLAFGELNMVTSILAGLLLGFGVDYGIHLTFRTRIELGLGKDYKTALRDAFLQAGRPALVSAVVTAGSFFMLLASDFRGFSQFGLLAGVGTFITAFTMFTFVGAVISILGGFSPELPRALIGTLPLPKPGSADAEVRIPRPRLILAVAALVVAALCVVALPLTDEAPPSGKLGFVDRLKYGVRFNYNSRALMPEGQSSVKIQDEITRRFNISSDPTAIYTKDLTEAKEVYDELTKNAAKYKTIDQVVSVYSFVPPPEIAAANSAVLAEWKKELEQLDLSVVPPELEKWVPMFKRILDAKPFDVSGVPAHFQAQFRHQPGTQPENEGWLTFIYPQVDLWDGKQMLAFSDETGRIRTEAGNEYRSAGSAILYAILARIVLWDGQMTLVLCGLWVLLMHYLDFRNLKLALASVVPLFIGLAMMLGIMTLIDARLNFMNIIMLPILIGFGISHGLYLAHRFLEGISPLVALRSVGAAVASSTLTTVAGFAALFAASHQGLVSMGVVSCLGLVTTLLVSFTVLAAVLQVLHDQRRKKAAVGAANDNGESALPTGSG